MQNVIGCLIYAILCTRPDLCYCVNLLSRFQTKNNLLVWELAKRILRYVNGTINLKLTFKKGELSNQLIGYADASYGDVVVVQLGFCLHFSAHTQLRGIHVDKDVLLYPVWKLNIYQLLKQHERLFGYKIY